MSDRYVLAADVGGTKTLLALARVHAGRPQVMQQAYLENHEFADFYAVLRTFCGQSACPPLQAVCLAVAGPVGEGRARLTNLAWQIESERIGELLPARPSVRLINDFSAIGFAIPALQEQDCVVLQQGTARPAAPVLVIGAGTGLGVCYRVADAQGVRVLPTEGGHLGFAPLNAEQMALLAYWRERLPRVSNENLLSGAGIERIFTYLDAQTPAANELLEAVKHDGAVAVSRYATSQNDPLARRTMELFFQIYGAVAGDMALALLAQGGVYIAGGIAAKNRELLLASGFMSAFLGKVPHEAIMRDIPVRLIVEQNAGLLGALEVAAQECGKK